LGLTLCDINTGRKIAANSQTDLKFPPLYGVRNLSHTSNGRPIMGVTSDWGTMLSSYYLRDLTGAQAADLLNTIIHEAIHYTYPYNDDRQKEDDNAVEQQPLRTLTEFKTSGFIDGRRWPDISAHIEYVPIKNDRTKVLDCPVALPGLTP
jgi:hypothetical protein